MNGTLYCPTTLIFMWLLMDDLPTKSEPYLGYRSAEVHILDSFYIAKASIFDKVRWSCFEPWQLKATISQFFGN